MRVAIGVEYDGRGFHGWERQARGRTVQAVLESALSRVADEALGTVVAGRTDTGVHGLAQVAHFDTGAHREERGWVFGANTNLPRDVSVLWARVVEPDFHARFSATGRRYRYVILNRRARPAALQGRVSWECRPLDAALMAEAAATLEGEHDFSAFRAAGCQARSPVRTLRRLSVRRDGDFVLIEAHANAFLQRMVRNLAGVLMSIGYGRHPVTWARQVLDGRDRRLGGVTAPPDGLYLTGVEYPEAFGIPELSPRIALW